jgi:integrase/recombinase XerD
MSLKLGRRKNSGHWYIRGTVRGKSVFETTGTNNKKAAEQIRIRREAQVLEESIHGRFATVTFAQAASSYIDSGGSPRFLGEFKDGRWTGLIGEFGTRKLTEINQSELDTAANKLYPSTSYKTRNRQCHAPFITVWNHAVRNKWAEPRQWHAPASLRERC